MGKDAFLGLPHWHRWRDIFDLAHGEVAHRPGWKAPTQGPLGELMVDRGTGAIRDLHDALAGRIFVHAVTQIAEQFDPAFDASTIELRESKGGAYLGVTITVTATSREQLDALYRALTSHPMVKVVL